jgi:glycosyltransferase involved in cell wall biosynthesis
VTGTRAGGKIHVAHFIHSLKGGGAERQIKLLVDALGKSVRTSIVCCDRRGAEDITEADVEVLELRKAHTYDLSVFSQCRRLFLELKPDVVHAWLPASLTIPAMITARLQSVPVLWSYRNKMFFTRPVVFAEFVAATGCADRIISNNEPYHSALPYRWLYRLKNGCVIRNAVDIPGGIERSAHWSPAAARPLRMIFVGRLVPAKNLLGLLEAVAQLPGDNWTLDVFGEGEQRAAAETLVRGHGLAPKVRFHGYNDRILEAMAQSDLLVMPSFFEGMPNALVEAMALGVPAIVSDIPAIRDIVPDPESVLWSRAGDIVDIRQAIVAVLEGRHDLAVMGDRVKAVKEIYSTKVMAQRYLDVYDSIVRTAI